MAGIFYFPSIQNYLDKESEKRISRLENITPIGIFTPEQVLENEKTLDGKKIAIKGEIKWISYPPRGKLPMPGMGPGFIIDKGIIALSGNREVYDALNTHKISVVKGVYKIKNNVDYRGYLLIPYKCKLCVEVLK